MKVKDLIQRLQKVDQDADVVLECFATNEPTLVAQYNDKYADCYNLVYIADTIDYIQDELEEDDYICSILIDRSEEK